MQHNLYYSNRIDVRHIRALAQLFAQHGLQPVKLRAFHMPFFVAAALASQHMLHIAGQHANITETGIRAILRYNAGQHVKSICPDIHSAIACNAACSH